jgi:hypothetical protein
MMAQSVNGLPLSPRIPSAGGAGAGGRPVGMMFGEPVVEPLPAPTVWPSIVGPLPGHTMPDVMHPPKGYVPPWWSWKEW